jgi:hypothetical protein
LPLVEFRVGPPGGPYVTVASVPRAQASFNGMGGWVASSGDFSKLVLQVPDHTLLGYSTHTVEGSDLYEYAGGQLRQVNVTGSGQGSTVGVCGASIARLSENGSRVFFEAVPAGEGCSEAKHLYMREDGGGEKARTVDLGAYRFIAANADGSSVLLDKSSGEDPGLYLYGTESAQAEFLPSSEVAANGGLVVAVSEGLGVVYIVGDGGLYRYDVAAKTLGFVTAEFASGGTIEDRMSISPDGRYLYFDAEAVAGLPGGGQQLDTPHASEQNGPTTQVYRYDSTEQVIQCLSCASSFDPEPRLSSALAKSGVTSASANGDYVFFDTPAALLPADVDGEVSPEEVGHANGRSEHPTTGDSINVSLSSDVYEWRGDGIGGCSRPQGCLALITSGHGGFLNILLGTTSTGGDVFFATKESLLPQDNDTAEDIYDARIDGGFPEAVAPVECKGDSCSTPTAAPDDLTPSSATFHGAGDLVGAAVAPAKAKPKKVKPKKKKKKIKKKARGKKSSKRAKRSNRRAK